MNVTRTALAALAIAGSGLAACGRQDMSKAEAGNQTVAVPSPGKSDPDASRSAFLAAAEPFEALTEQAATAGPNRLRALIAEVRKAADGIGPALSPSRRTALGTEVTQIDVAARSDLRTRVALSAVEGYRTLVESARDTGKVPRAVSLLDYAGFRYQANLAAAPVDWKDVGAALAFARTQWAVLSPEVDDAALRKEFGASLSVMESAANARDTAAARKAATAELDLVDKLESYFGARN